MRPEQERHFLRQRFSEQLVELHPGMHYPLIVSDLGRRNRDLE